MVEPTIRSEVAAMLRDSQVYLYPDKIDGLAELTKKMREVHGGHVKALDEKSMTAKNYLRAMRTNSEIFLTQARILLGDHDYEKVFGKDDLSGFPINDALFLSENYETAIGRRYYKLKVDLAAKLYLLRHNLKRATNRPKTAGP
jgi:hypothetical protein